MHTSHVTTPFGRRPVTLALIKDQLSAAETRSDGCVEKWKVFRDVCEARERFDLQDRALAVLDALLTFYPDPQLRAEKGLVVFPSNAQLSVRAHGITESTLRRQIGALVDAGLIQRRDSPNGKRYAHRSRDGEIEQAYGFDLSPLLARATELELLAQDVAAERNRFRRAKEALTICRRDVRKMITAAIEEGVPGNWLEIETTYIDILRRLPHRPARTQVEAILGEMTTLRNEILNALEKQLNSKKLKGNDSQNDGHIQNSKPEPINELEPSSRKEQGENWVQEQSAKSANRKPITEKVAPNQSFPLGMVLRACPQIADYGPAGGISHWRELMTAAVVVRSMLGVSPSAYEEACNAMGPENTAVAMACILERSNFINSAGGYLRDLSRRAERGEFSLGPMLMSLLKLNSVGIRRVG